MERIKYITNKELLLEIDRSKKTYSYFKKPEYARFDAIVRDVSQITPAFLDATLQKRLELVAKQGPAIWGNALADGIDIEDLIIRVMTSEHIPHDPTRKRRLKVPSDEGQTKTPFPPFKHYKMVNGVLTEVGRSHWKGDLNDGEFSLEHGRISNRLAIMFMLLVERYSKRGNWRGYCVDETTEALTQRGWLGVDQINEDDIILSYDAGHLKWSKIKSIFRDDYKGKMFHLTVRGMDALVTPGHKFITDSGLKQAEHLLEKDKVILTGAPVEDGLGYGDRQPRNLTMKFVLSLSQTERVRLIEELTNEDGDYDHENPQTDVFLALCAMAGYQTHFKQGRWTVQKGIAKAGVHTIDFHGGKRPDRKKNKPVVDYSGRVWCPETEFGSFMARRNNTIYLTGNTYNDEMRSHALLQLSQIGLQFDESKSDNPFAFYTQVIKNVFVRCLNVERKVQHIRDDLLIIAGVQPSYTRQIDHEIEQRFGDEKGINVPSDSATVSKVVELPVKRGRRPKNQQPKDTDPETL